MDAAMKSLWCDALRSGKYEQGKFYLQNDGKFCCLGVLCEVNNVPSSVNEDGNTVYKINGYGKIKAVPNNYCGLAMAELDKLMIMNDGGNTFEEIAYWIEQNIQQEEI